MKIILHKKQITKNERQKIIKPKIQIKIMTKNDQIWNCKIEDFEIKSSCASSFPLALGWKVSIIEFGHATSSFDVYMQVSPT